MSKKVSENNITLKISYITDSKDILLDYQQRYSKLLRYTYNRLKKLGNLKQKELYAYQKLAENINLDSYFFNYAQYEARALINNDDTLNMQSRVFGGKQNNILRSQNKITKEEYLSKRLNPICCIGQAANNGNCKVQILDYQTILFKPSRKDHIYLNLLGLSKSYKRYFDFLIQHQETCDIPITYRIDQNYVYITFDLNQLEVNDFEYSYIENRVFAIDMNPNYIGYTVCDWKNSTEFKVISAGVISIKPLNDYENTLKLSKQDKKKKYCTNKRKYEVIQISKKLVKLAKHYQCEIFALENLNIKSKNNNQGKNFNRLVNNQWCRNLFINQIRKRVKQSLMNLEEVVANYSSFIGNLAYRNLNLPDMCLSSIEIGRRGYEFNHQYIKKDIKKSKNIIFNNDPQVRNYIALSLEELNFIDTWESLSDLYFKVKKAKLQYRFQLNENDAVFSKYYSKQKVKFYTFV